MHPESESEPEPTLTGAPSFPSTHTAGVGDSERTGDYEPKGPPPLPTVPGYTLQRELGRGGMGIVYLAIHDELKRPVALKMLLYGALAGSPTVARFLAESEALAALQHPHIVQVFARGEHHGLPFFAMEYCPQGSLADRVKEAPLPSAEAARIVAQLADAIATAHAQKILHRDLKPGNILYAADGTPKISDFGLVKRLDQRDEPLTHTGAVLGTPSYMAPEQAEGKEARNAADIYGLGAILYRLLTGRAPYVASSSAVTLQLVLAGDLIAPRQLNHTVTRDLETICLKCLQRVPSQRYASAADLAADLGRWMRQEPIHARPVGVVERGRKWCNRHPARAALVAALVLLMGTIITATSYIAVREHAAATTEAKLNTDLRLEQAAKDQALRNERIGSARLALDRGLLLCEQGDIARGLLAMNAGLTPAIDAEATDVEDALRHNLAAWKRECWPLQVVEQGLPGVHVARATIAPQGELVAIAYSNNTVVLRPLTGKGETHTLPHEAVVEQLTFAADGQRLLTRTRTRLRVWDTRTGKVVGASVDTTGLTATAFSPEGITFAYATSDRRVHLHDVSTGQTRHEWPPTPFPVVVLAFRPDGRELATSDNTFLRRWDTTTGKSLGMSLPHDGSVVTATYSPDGRYLATGTRLGPKAGHAVVSLWKADGTLVVETPLVGGTQPEVLFSPDSLRYVSRTSEGAVEVRRTSTGALLASPSIRQGATSSLAFSPDRTTLLLGGRNGQMRFWHLASGTMHGPVLHHQSALRDMSFSADGQHLITVDGALRHWHRPPGTRHAALTHTGDVFSLAFRPDRKQLLTGGSGGVSVWDVVSGQRLRELQPAGVTFAVAYTPNGKHALSAGGSHASRLWDTQTWQTTATLPPHDQGTLAATISPDGTLAVTAGADGFARLWRIPAGQPVGQPLTHQARVQVVAFRPDGQVLLCGCADGSAQLWNVTTGQPLGEPLAHKNIEAVAFTPDGKFALTAGHDTEVRVWDASTAQRVGQVTSPSTHCQALALSPNSQYVLACGFNAIVPLQKLPNGEPVGLPLQQHDAIRAAMFAPDGQTVLTGSYDGTARRWHVPTGFPVGPVLRDEQRLRVVAYSPDGRWCATGGWGRNASLWAIAPPRLGTPTTIQRDLERRHGLLFADDGSMRATSAAEWQAR